MHVSSSRLYTIRYLPHLHSVQQNNLLKWYGKHSDWSWHRLFEASCLSVAEYGLLLCGGWQVTRPTDRLLWCCYKGDGQTSPTHNPIAFPWEQLTYFIHVDEGWAKCQICSALHIKHSETASYLYRIYILQKWGMWIWLLAVAYPGILFGWGSTNSVEGRGQREPGSVGGSPLVSGSGGSCKFGTRNFISYSKTSSIFSTLRLFMMTTNLFVIANVKQLRT